MDELHRIQQAILVRLSTDSHGSVLFSQVQQEIEADARLTANALRGLLESRRVSLRRGSGTDTQMYLSLASDLNENLSVVLDTVRASGTSGVDQAQLMAKLRISKSELVKSLHALISQKYIQERRSFTNRAKRIYLLYHLEPSAQVTGGTFYCGEELDIMLVDELRRRLVVFVEQQQQLELQQMSFVNSSDVYHGTNAAAAGHDLRGVSLQDILRFMAREGLCEGDGVGVVPGEVETGRSPTISFAASPMSSQQKCNNHNMWKGGDGVKAIIQTLAAPPASDTTQMKRIGTHDARLLVQSLVLDGVLEEVCGHDARMSCHDGSTHGGSYDLYSSSNRCRQQGTLTMAEKDAFSFDDLAPTALLSRHASSMDMRQGDDRDNAVTSKKEFDRTLVQRYRLATGRNVLRHFTAQPKQPSLIHRNGMPSLNESFSNQHNTYATSTAHSCSPRMRQGRLVAVKRERDEVDDADFDMSDNFPRHRNELCRGDRRGTTEEQDGDDDHDGRHARQLVRLVREGGAWELAEVSRPTGASNWAYTPALGMPCLGCPQLGSCSTSSLGIVNPATCVYLNEWLS